MVDEAGLLVALGENRGGRLRPKKVLTAGA